MINMWCKRPSISLGLLSNKIRELGVATKLWTGFECPTGAINWGRGGGSKYEELQRLAAVGIPVPPYSRTKHPDWLARTEHHKEARDLLRALKVGDYYVQYVPTVREHRVHVIKGKVVRVQGKVPRVPEPNLRFRSWRAGWKLVASPKHSDSLPESGRNLAKKAVEALGYDFGAVDIGTKADGSPIVWEVNSGPGLEGGTVTCYARAFIREFS